MGKFAAVWAGVMGLSVLLVLRPAPARAASEFLPSLSHDDVDMDAYQTWADGGLRPPGVRDPFGALVMRTNGIDCEKPAAFGNSENPGVRYLRYGFKHVVTIGSVLIRGNTDLSFLKSGAAYPGDLRDESVWEPAQRLTADGKITLAAAGPNDYTVWVLPPGTTTRALRLTHNGHAGDKGDPYIHGPAGTAWGILCWTGRVANIAIEGKATASVRNDIAAKLNNGIDDGRDWMWDNSPRDNKGQWQPAPLKPSMMIQWPQAVTLCGMQLQGELVQSVAVDMYIGPASQPPRLADDGQWKQVATFDDFPVDYPARLGVRVMDFGQTITTRAVRLRLLEGKDTSSGKVHPHMVGRSMNGQRFEISEILAYMPLDRKDLGAAVISAPRP